MSQLGQVVYVDINKVHPNKYNPNVMDEEKFNALVDFCKTQGADKLDPIWIRNDGIDKYEVIDGEHRWKAAKEVGWVKLRAFIVDMDVADATAFNVRKNRERGLLDAFKLGSLFLREEEDGLTSADIANKYGYSISKGKNSTVCYLLDIARHEKEIKQQIISSEGEIPKRISYKHALNVLRELKREERGEQPRETKEIVDEMVNEVAPALEKAFEKVKPHDKHNPERNKLVLNMLLKNLTEGLLFCPVCKEKMLECSHCHTSLAKMKEAKQL